MIDNILPVLTFAGLLVGFASTIWGLFAKPTIEDEKGNKRLTSQGQVTVALAGFAFLISVSSFGFGLVLEQEAAKKAAQDAVVELQKERLREVRDLKQFVLTQKTLQETEDSRLEQYQNEIKRQADDARAALRISGENQTNLAGIAWTLDGVERLLQPLGKVSGHLALQLHLDGRASDLRSEVNCEANPYGQFPLLKEAAPEEEYVDLVLIGEELRNFFKKSYIVVNFATGEERPGSLIRLDERSEMYIYISTRKFKATDLVDYDCETDSIFAILDIREGQMRRQPGFRSVLDLEESTVRTAFVASSEDSYSITLRMLSIKAGDSVYQAPPDSFGNVHKGKGQGEPPTIELKLVRAI